MCTMCILSSCNGGEMMKYSGAFANLNQPISSPSGSYSAIIEEFNDNGVNSYKLYIVDLIGNGTKHETDLIFRARDRNYVFWADEEDVLWGYSGDVGTFFWVIENDSWIKKAYTDNKDAKVPQALKDARPNRYE